VPVDGPSCHQCLTIPGQQQCFQLSRSNTTMRRLACLHGSPLPHTHRPDASHAGPMVCVWAAPPRHIPNGLRAQQGVNTHIQEPTCVQHTTTDTESAKTQTHSAKTACFQRFLPNGSALWRPHHPKPRPRRHQAGGIARHGGPTRRQHAIRGLHVVQNPHCDTASKPPGWHTPPNWIGNNNLDRLSRSG